MTPKQKRFATGGTKPLKAWKPPIETLPRNLSLRDQPRIYAAFYAVSALLLEDGHRFRKHSGVRASFNRHLIKTGRLARKHGDLYNRLFRDRQEGDYIDS